MAPELFFPTDAASWRPGGRYSLPRSERHGARTEISGVRLHAADPTGEDPGPERQCQADVVNLVATVQRLRSVPGLGNVVLSRETLRSRQPGRRGVRVKFGLLCDPAGRHAGEEEAARRCHRRIVGAIRKAGLVVEHPRRFAGQGGFGGLERWGSELRLRRRCRPWWLLLFLPLLLLLFLRREGGTADAAFFGVPIGTTSVVLLVDKSSSMGAHFPALRAEARRVLQRMRAADGTHYAEIVAYDAGARAALGGLREVDAKTSEALEAFLDGLQAGGGTNLQAGLREAARLVAKHDRPTTLVILTDGRDGSIAPMLADPELLRGFGGVKVVGHALTPRLFGDTGDPAPVDDAERNLEGLAARMGGRFGRTTPGEAEDRT